MKTKISLSLSVVIFTCIIAIWLSTISCSMTPAVISPQAKVVLLQQVEKMPLLVLIEGFQPLSKWRMNDLGKRISSARKISACATSGNHHEHMPIIRQAHKNHQKIFIAGFSTGEREALLLAEDCKNENIPIEKLFLLDGTKKANICSNVKCAVDMVGGTPYSYRRAERYCEADLENDQTVIKHYELMQCDHLDVPAQSYDMFLLEIPSVD